MLHKLEDLSSSRQMSEVAYLMEFQAPRLQGTSVRQRQTAAQSDCGLLRRLYACWGLARAASPPSYPCCPRRFSAMTHLFGRQTFLKLDFGPVFWIPSHCQSTIDLNATVVGPMRQRSAASLGFSHEAVIIMQTFWSRCRALDRLISLSSILSDTAIGND